MIEVKCDGLYFCLFIEYEVVERLLMNARVQRMQFLVIETRT